LTQKINSEPVNCAKCRHIEYVNLELQNI